jgi:hypothetical protein
MNDAMERRHSYLRGITASCPSQFVSEEETSSDTSAADLERTKILEPLAFRRVGFGFTPQLQLV